MKKLIAKMLIVILLISFIIPKGTLNTNVYASSSASNYKSLAESGTMNVNGNSVMVNDTYSRAESIAMTLGIVSNAIATTVMALLGSCINDGDITQATNFTIARLISGEYDILNNDFLLETNDIGDNASKTNETIKQQVSGWYYTIRNLSIIISLLILIYIGIRMAISTLADDKSRYQKMFFAWVQSFILIFFLHFIMIIAMFLQESLMDALLSNGPLDGQAERTIAWDCWVGITTKRGWDIVWFTILYWCLTYYQVKFFFLYAKRMIATAFLIVIAPLITVTYSIDKAGDGKAQAFNAWLKEFLVNVFIQPIHFIVYSLFIITASELATIMPLFTMIFFGALSRGEKVVKGLFGTRNMKSIHSIGRGKKRG